MKVAQTSPHRNVFFLKEKVERHDMNTLSLPLNIRRGGSDTNLNFDVPDGILDFHKAKLNTDSLKQKILKVTEQIKIEQTSRDGNVAEYLKLVNSADKQQAGRIKQVFEKKNQKSAHSIAQLQKKLEHYHRKLKEIEQNGAARSSKDLKDIHRSLRDAQVKSRTAPHSMESSKSGGMPGVSLTPPVFVFNKSREFANLIRNKFGSADNIAHLKNSLEEFRPEAGARAYGGSATIVNKPKYGSDDECSSGTSGSADSNGNQSFGAGGPGQLHSQGKLTMVLEELREIKETQAQLAEDIEALKVQLKREYGFISQTLQEERYRYERLEDQLHDLTDLHQHETANLKQALASVEEKVAYQAYERSRDIQEALESCQTRISKLELHQQEQQVLQTDTVNAKVLLGKCINVVLAFMTVVLVCVSTIARFVSPMMKSRSHILGTFFAVTLLAIFCKNWDHIVCAVERIIIPR
ncbi:transmembrane and coiled-coil domain protein 3 isoform X3 [Erinaceus europaeus]|uniref:Transmembrane and coiled-coil domain protein 3 isoform X3 n=1 Tax=Erinaceus europaeus TaxID=9365 RepID=A0ABM3XRT9_ERIEU|nr:transmembrane and coiled-coil domain protein 3 isoform X3 [Erinaceus europaeus]XP_060051541.1 transmembrane and coiled-coil domain protein 3 isoform X3 [Erinaceus europaeus]